MMSYRDGWVVRQIKGDFRKIGYENVECSILNAADYGTPQNRKRIIYVATRKNSRIGWPERTHFPPSEFDRSLIDPNAKPQVNVMDAIGDLPPIKNRTKGAKLTDNPMPYRSKPSCEFQRWIRDGSKQVHNHITRWHRNEDLKVFSHMSPGMKWSDLADRDRKLIGYSDESFNDKWKRLPTDGPSWTVVSHLQKDGYMYIHPTQDRTISVREAARLQSFPDTFVFEGSRSSQFKQVGNAVPPLLAFAIAKKVKSMLAS
jgi:DNA (cytosine-5)-methyltransferase 1